MTVRTILTAAALTTALATTLAATTVLAQAAPGAVLVVPAKDIAAHLAVAAKPGAAVTFPITTTASYRTMIAHRTVDGTPEQHAHWIDVMMVLQGEITLTTGGTITGNTVDADGESHGGKITGGTSVVLHAGDYFQVPAGLPHLMTAPKGDFRYSVTKIHA